MIWNQFVEAGGRISENEARRASISRDLDEKRTGSACIEALKDVGGLHPFILLFSHDVLQRKRLKLCLLGRKALELVTAWEC